MPVPRPVDVVVTGDVDPSAVAPLPCAGVPVEMRGVMPVRAVDRPIPQTNLSKLHLTQLDAAEAPTTVIPVAIVDPVVVVIVIMTWVAESARDTPCLRILDVQQ